MQTLMGKERRVVPLIGSPAIEFRASDKQITGMAAVYYDGSPKTEYNLTDNIIERVHPGAFDNALKPDMDIFGLYDHKENMLLGRRSAKTLKIESTKDGLSYSIPYDETDPTHVTVAARVRRGDVRGSSVTWFVDEGQTYERRADGKIIRNIISVDYIVDVGPVLVPAYSATTVNMRSLLSMEDIEKVQQMAKTALPLPPTPIEFYLAQRGKR